MEGVHSQGWYISVTSGALGPFLCHLFHFCHEHLEPNKSQTKSEHACFQQDESKVYTAHRLPLHMI